MEVAGSDFCYSSSVCVETLSKTTSTRLKPTNVEFVVVEVSLQHIRVNFFGVSSPSPPFFAFFSESSFFVFLSCLFICFWSYFLKSWAPTGSLGVERQIGVRAFQLEAPVDVQGSSFDLF